METSTTPTTPTKRDWKNLFKVMEELQFWPLILQYLLNCLCVDCEPKSRLLKMEAAAFEEQFQSNVTKAVNQPMLFLLFNSIIGRFRYEGINSAWSFWKLPPTWNLLMFCQEVAWGAFSLQKEHVTYEIGWPTPPLDSTPKNLRTLAELRDHLENSTPLGLQRHLTLPMSIIDITEGKHLRDMM